MSLRACFSLSLAALVGCNSGPNGCPDGFFQDAAGECIELADDNDDGSNNESPPSDSSGSIELGGGTSSIYVHNDSFDDICELYITACSDPSWGSDLLGASILEPGFFFALNGLDSGCYDIGAVTCSGFSDELLGNTVNGELDIYFQ